jgi:hypothetical protein
MCVPALGPPAISLPPLRMNAQAWKAEQRRMREAVRAQRRSPDGRTPIDPVGSGVMPDQRAPGPMTASDSHSHTGADSGHAVEASRARIAPG